MKAINLAELSGNIGLLMSSLTALIEDPYDRNSIINIFPSIHLNANHPHYHYGYSLIVILIIYN